jgi:(hydroxyamino)benzene mutase
MRFHTGPRPRQRPPRNPPRNPYPAKTMNRFPIQLGFILILLALLTGPVIPLAVTPRLVLAAHTVGVIGGLVLIAIGALAPAFALGPRTAATMTWLWVYAAYANWLACLLGGLTGASRLTPIAGAGTSGTWLAEITVSILLETLAATSIVATGLAVWGLRAAPRTVQHPLIADAVPRPG